VFIAIIKIDRQKIFEYEIPVNVKLKEGVFLE